MKYIIKLFFVPLVILAFAVTVYAASPAGSGITNNNSNEARIILSPKNTKLIVGETVTVNVKVKNAPVIYGVDVRLTFDPQMLEVVDANDSQAGIQFVPGNFIDPNESFIVQNNVDNSAGTIDYALSLLNPAPAVNGNGELFQVTFRAKAEGQAIISITEGMFGTQSGETISPDLSSAEIRISGKSK